MATKPQQQKYLMTQRSGYEPSPKKSGRIGTPQQLAGWNSTTQISTTSRMFDGMQARPYSSQLAGSPKARAKSGPRSIANWQRDYNTKGLCDEKCTTLRFQRVVKMKLEAAKEAERRCLNPQVVEEEMYQALRARSHRTDTNLRKSGFHEPARAVTVGGGPPKLFDGSSRLEEHFSFKDARVMFRGDAWEAMTETLSKVNEFKPPARALDEEAKRIAGGGTRGSFSVAVTPAELSKAMTVATQKKELATAADLASLNGLKKILVRKYGTITAAWRHLLDPGHTGKLSFQEWSKALRHIGFEGSIPALYKILDDDDSGIVTFSEFMPQLAARMKEFKRKMRSRYGDDLDVIWKQIDDNGNNQIDVQEFVEICGNIGYNGNNSELFKELRYHPSRKFLTLQDFKDIPTVL